MLLSTIAHTFFEETVCMSSPPGRLTTAGVEQLSTTDLVSRLDKP
jgi:hypothetical protein